MKIDIAISVIALFVAISSAVASWRVSRRQTAAQERLLALETRRERDRQLDLTRAQLRAAIVHAGQNEWKLRIQNDGNGQARAISVTIDGVDLIHSDRVIGVDQPIRTLGSGADAEFWLHVYMGSDFVYVVELSWEDDSGDIGRWSSELRI